MSPASHRRSLALVFLLLLPAACGSEERSDTGSEPAAFASWKEVADLLDEEYRLADRTSNSVKIVFEYDDERLQAVLVSHYESFDERVAMVDFASAVGPVNAVDAEAYLRENFDVAIGAFAIDGENLVFRDSLPLKEMSAESLHRHLNVIAASADEAEQSLDVDVH